MSDHQPTRFTNTKTNINYVLASDYDVLLAEWADASVAKDILRDWLDGNDHGYPLPNGEWEPDIVARARALLEAEARSE